MFLSLTDYYMAVCFSQRREIMVATTAVYRPRNQQSSDYYRCVEGHFETFLHVYEERFERKYGFWRPYLQKVISRYLDCGDPHNGIAFVKCRAGYKR